MQLFQLAAVLLFWQTVSGQPITFCGPEPCLVPINSMTCQDLILNFEFLGSCCRLVDIPATGGCRVEVSGPGNCAWVPFCGSCDPNDDSFCGHEYSSENEVACPDLDYDALAIQSAWVNFPTCMPSAAPSFAFSESPTNPPTFAPSSTATPTSAPSSTAAPTFAPTPSSGVSITIRFVALSAGTLCATLF